jgi:hypothetical protein
MARLTATTLFHDVRDKYNSLMGTYAAYKKSRDSLSEIHLLDST